MADRITIFDIAKESGVSIATVSRVLAGAANVRPTTREKVTNVINKYHFKPNMIASGLGKGKSHTIGIIVPLVENPYYTKLCLAAQQEAQRANHSVILYQLQGGMPLTQDFIDLLIGKRLDGLIISGDISTPGNEASLWACIHQVKQYMPLVIVSPWCETDECICLHSGLEPAMRVAIRHLMRLGHTRIAMLGGAGITGNTKTREYAYIDEMAAQGLAPYPSTTGDTLTEGELCVLKLFNGLAGREPPTAVVCFNDLIALGALKQLKLLGYRVPEDIALVGCDNQFFADYAAPPLTTVDLRIEETAWLAMRTLISTDETPIFQQTLNPTLVVRESCGAHMQDARTVQHIK